MADDATDTDVFSFYKGAEDVLRVAEKDAFDWASASSRVCESVNDALNAKHLSFLFGSGCSSHVVDETEQGIPTMGPLARQFLDATPAETSELLPTSDERDRLQNTLGLDLNSTDFSANLERLMDVLYSFSFVLQRSDNTDLAAASDTVDSLIQKVTSFITARCTTQSMYARDSSLLSLYQGFYRKLAFRDRSLPRPWVFTTNYDLFNELALDRLGMPYCNGFSGTIERSFNPTTYRHALAEKMDLRDQRWSVVDGFVYLCKLHGSVNWIEEEGSLFPIRELPPRESTSGKRVMIYPTPMKQHASFGSPYADLFREFQSRLVRDQSVLFVVGYSFGDEHVNNAIYQALTVPTFRLVALLDPTGPRAQQLIALRDPRIWIIGGGSNTPAHYFSYFVESLLPELPEERVDTAVQKVLEELVSKGLQGDTARGNDGD